MIKTNIGILPWRNEGGAFSYPMVSNVISIPGFIVDAYWIQMDSFVPVLKSVVVNAENITFNIRLDSGDASFAFQWPNVDRVLTMYDDTTGRMIGKLFFGDGVEEFYTSYLGSTLSLNTPFVASTVHGIPSDAGIFSLQGITGNVVINNDSNLFFTPSSEGVIFDAIGVPSCDPTLNPVKSINGISAKNVSIVTNDIINWIPIGGGVRLEIATGSLFNTSVHPSE